MTESTDWALLARYLSGECSEAEKAEVEAWLASDIENRNLMASMKTVWETPEPQSQASDVNRLWGEVAEKAGIATGSEAPHQNRGIVLSVAEWVQPRVYPILGYAAVLLVAASLAYMSQIFPRGDRAVELEQLAVKNGVRDEITLSDGTRIALDSGSLLKYPKTFDNNTRDVFLTGEGYFEVAPNAEKPFIVHANRAVVKVLGTKFNVRAWQPDQKVTVVVSEGKISFGSKDGSVEDAVVMIKGQASSLLANGRPSEPHAVDIEKHLGWMQNEVFFESAPLSEILYQLERWYNVQFVLEQTSAATEQLTLHVQAKSLEDVLELISALTGLDYERTDDRVRFKSRD